MPTTRAASGPAAPGGGHLVHASPRVPVRTCVGCGGRSPQRELVRLRVREGEVVVDPGRSGGRGAWLHPAPGCLEKATRRRVFGRALRAPGAQADPAALRDLLTGNTRKD